MSGSKRKIFTRAQKAKVALEAVRGAKTINEIAQEHEAHPTQVRKYRDARGEASASRANKEILNNPGKVSRTVAEKLAHQAYEKSRVTQDRHFESDFDKSVKKMLKKND